MCVDRTFFFYCAPILLFFLDRSICTHLGINCYTLMHMALVEETFSQLQCDSLFDSACLLVSDGD